MQVQITINYLVEGFGTCARSQAVTYFLVQNVDVNPKTGDVTVTGNPTQLKAAVITQTRQQITK
jgi:acetolactate synthase small subunit